GVVDVSRGAAADPVQLLEVAAGYRRDRRRQLRSVQVGKITGLTYRQDEDCYAVFGLDNPMVGGDRGHPMRGVAQRRRIRVGRSPAPNNYPLSLHDALPIYGVVDVSRGAAADPVQLLEVAAGYRRDRRRQLRSV